MTADTPPQRQPAGLSPPRVYSVPRRYDLATLFAVSLAYALLFGGMRLCGAPPAVIATVALFVTVIGIGQALLFKGKSPRLASVVVGCAIWLTLPIVSALWYSGLRGLMREGIVFGILCSIFPGVIVSYCAGACVGGVFLVADGIRRALGRRTDHLRGDPVGDDS